MTLEAAAPRLLPLDLNAEHTKYFLKNGKQVPGCTAICGGTMDAPHLQAWYHKLGAKGIKWPCKEEVGTDLGKVAHGHIQAYLQGYDGLDPTGLGDLWTRALPIFGKFLQRWNESGYRLVASELQLVSERLQVGGTKDILAYDPMGRLLLLDAKTSGPYRAGRWSDADMVLDVPSGIYVPRVGPYKKVKVQVGGYATIARENGYAVEEVRVWRLGKLEDDPGQVHVIRDLPACMTAFETAVAHFHSLKAL